MFPGALSCPGRRCISAMGARLAQQRAPLPLHVDLEGSGLGPTSLGHTREPGEPAQVTQARHARHRQVQVQEPGQIPAMEIARLWQLLTSWADGGFSPNPKQVRLHWILVSPDNLLLFR